ncbi:MAG TPA: sialidase family protein, partial [Gemmataceae bacterium]|nr:sialidase family protein [Gemmataceae bacterium]
MNRQVYFLAALLLGPMLWLSGAPCAADTQVVLTRTPNGGIQPQAVMSADGTLHLIYFKGKPGAGDLYYVHRPAGQGSFTQPIRVNSQPGSAVAIGTIRGGQIALGRGGHVFVVWNGSSKAQPRDPENAFPVLYTRLNQAKTAFEPQRNLMRKTTGLDGGATIAADQDGHVYIAWHGLDQHGPKGEEHRRVWVARSDDDGKTWTDETAVSPAITGACGCCGMRAGVDRHGNVYLLYRSAREEVHRDMYLLVSRDHGHTFEARKLQPWQINGCPMSSEAFVEGPDGVSVAWETDGQVYASVIDEKKGDVSHPDSAPG